MPSSIIADRVRVPVQPLAVALGDPAGVGSEIVVKAWSARDVYSLSPFFAVGDLNAVRKIWSGAIERIDTPAAAPEVFSRALPVLQVEDAGDVVMGEPSAEGARCALAALEVAAGLTRSNAASALVTAPVSKVQLYGIGFTHPGQTEFIAERCGVASDNAVMMLAGPSLRVVPVTTHVALSEVKQALSIELIVAKARATVRGLIKDFGIAVPRLAFAGCNPHAGEGGMIGREEIDIIRPAVEQLRDEGVAVMGPIAADALFHPRARAQYDAAICMYHDQALIPLKTLHFDEGVNVTLGLPIVRTAPDHGTAFGIAGRDQANPGAMIAALRLAAAAAVRRASGCAPPT